MSRFSRACLASAAVLVAVAGAAAITSASENPPPPSADQPIAGPRAPMSLTPSPEGKYRSITPCRIVDGREGLGTLPSGSIRSYEVRGTFGFAPQGGRSGGCGIPTAATSVTFSITVISPNRSGFLRAWPAGGAEPQATLMNYTAEHSQTITAPVTLSTSGAKDLTVKSYGADALIVIDVQGFTLPSIHAQVSVDGALAQGTSRVVSSSRSATGTYQVVIDRDLAGCSVAADPYGSGSYIAAGFPSGSTVSVFTYSTTTGTPTNIQFQLIIDC